MEGTPRAKAALSPVLQLLHELVHYRGKTIAGGSAPSLMDARTPDEPFVVKDVDDAVAVLSDTVARRSWYGKGQAINAQGRSEDVNQNAPGKTYVLGAEGINFEITFHELGGQEWVKWPTATQLLTGVK
jgi:hypothetical protein